ncbi:7-deoxyloganetic acid glucosyltransferase-like [Humulus lupulus]|uniref:7-deoxyloganetic acid glucosyltransferase-like n=1 Tax=Humulus lupulus TaxID=3486 RepID=UPI002B400B6A|nr:7-deoxyloganetic acid glucosyltransferase-like [Humulus lupulus]
MENQRPQTVPRVLIFPMPAQGHVNPMLKLAELLAMSGIHITFLNTDHIHNRLIKYTDIETRYSKYTGFIFRTISDGLDEDHPRKGKLVWDIVHSLHQKAKPVLKEMLVSGQLGSGDSPSVTYMISDGLFGEFTIDVGEELGIPTVHFRCSSACYFWSYFFFPRLLESGEIPITNMDKLISSVPGMESFLRARDLPSMCRVTDVTTDQTLHMVHEVTYQSHRARALILNTFEDLEGPIVRRITEFCPNIYTIGPLHTHLNVRLAQNSKWSSDQSSNNLYDEDRSCLTWLDSQPPHSVIYVSFGSITVVSKAELLEFWYGLVNSKQRFLWVMPPDMVLGEDGENSVPADLEEATRERGCMVGYAPQEQVLAHSAVGGFLTHSGWNSTLESIGAGVPMICWPYFGDQQINSRFVSQVWNLGLDMKDVCDRKVVEKMVNDLMVERRREFAESTAEMARLAKRSVNEGGPSYSNLERLIQDIISCWTN